MSTARIDSVAIPAGGWDIAADLRFPADFDESRTYPAIIISHPIGSTKDQTAGTVYGKALAEAGFITVAYDASFQGASGGEPRHLEDPNARVQDFSYVIDYLVTLPYVDADRIGAAGVCGSGGYVVSAATTERRIKAVATITGANYGRLFHESFSGYDPIAKLEDIARQRTAEARGAAPRVDGRAFASADAVRAAGVTDVDAIGCIDYYTRREPHPSGTNEALYSRLSTAVGWDAFAQVDTLLTQPLCVVIGSIPGGLGAYRDGFDLIRRARSTDKELVVVDGYARPDLYDNPEAVGQALERLVPFFAKHL